MLFKEIKLTNILSFGDEGETIPLGPLNVLIGPNGSGKSNLIEVISLLQAAPRDILKAVSKGGGVSDLLWKGGENTPVAEVGAAVSAPGVDGERFRHTLSFYETGQRFFIYDEHIELEKPSGGNVLTENLYSFQKELQASIANENTFSPGQEGLDPQQSILSQMKDPNDFSGPTLLGYKLGRIKIYRDWQFGRRAKLRQPQPADAPGVFLDEDCLNLGLVLNQHRGKPAVKREILKYLADFYEGLEDFDISVIGNTVQIVLQEGDVMIPATRLSDGTLRYLCLLAILCHPEPPPLVCIEEPELGLHPDIIPILAELLKKASTRSQLIVTTHSEILIDALSDTPESVVVCEKENGRTSMKRLDADQLKDWLEKYTLGELWVKGEIGGNRW